MSKEKAIELLKKVEWGTRLAHCHGVDSSGGRSQCQICKNEKYQGHRKDCKLAQALASLAPEQCKTCRGSGEKEFPEAKQAWDIPDAPIPTETCPRCKGTGIEPDCKPEPTGFTKEWLVEQVGVGIHTGLRKFADSHEACEAHRAIEKMSTREWRNICQIVAGVIYKRVIALLDSQQAEIGRLKEEAKKAYFAIELLTPSNFVGIIKIPPLGQVYNHRAFWEMLFGGQAQKEQV